MVHGVMFGVGSRWQRYIEGELCELKGAIACDKKFLLGGTFGGLKRIRLKQIIPGLKRAEYDFQGEAFSIFSVCCSIRVQRLFDCILNITVLIRYSEK